MGQSFSKKIKKSRQQIHKTSTHNEHIEPSTVSNTANETKDVQEAHVDNSTDSNAVNTKLETSPLTHLPMDLILEIFSQIEVFEIISFQLVSKSWCDLLRSQRLWRVKCQQYWPNYPLHAISDYFKFFLKRGGVYFIRSAEHLNRIATDDSVNYRITPFSISNPHQLSNGLVLCFEKSEKRYRKKKSKDFWSKTAPTFKDGCNLVLAPKFLEDEDYDYILLEMSFSHQLMDIFDQVNFANPTVYCEKNIIKIMLQIMKALKSLHDLNIAADRWNDFSFVVDMCGDWFEVKLEYYKDRYSSPPSIGMPYISFTSPDVMAGTTDTLESNMWSLGIMAYTFLVGMPTFYSTHWPHEYRAILKGEYTWPENTPISDKAKDFVNRLILVDPTKRMTLKEAFAHPWLNDPNPLTAWLEQAEKAFLGPLANRPQSDDAKEEEHEDFNHSTEHV